MIRFESEARVASKSKLLIYFVCVGVERLAPRSGGRGGGFGAKHGLPVEEGREAGQRMGWLALLARGRRNLD